MWGVPIGTAPPVRLFLQGRLQVEGVIYFSIYKFIEFCGTMYARAVESVRRPSARDLNKNVNSLGCTTGGLFTSVDLNKVTPNID